MSNENDLVTRGILKEELDAGFKKILDIFEEGFRKQRECIDKWVDRITKKPI